MKQLKLTAVYLREGNGFVALCPELDIGTQGDSLDEARENLREAVEGFFEVASPQEVEERLRTERHVEQLEVSVG